MATDEARRRRFPNVPPGHRIITVTTHDGSIAVHHYPDGPCYIQFDHDLDGKKNLTPARLLGFLAAATAPLAR